jgi:hypothetical protein
VVAGVVVVVGAALVVVDVVAAEVVTDVVTTDVVEGLGPFAPSQRQRQTGSHRQPVGEGSEVACRRIRSRIDGYAISFVC